MLNYGLRYASNNDVQLHGFTNSDWAGSADERRSASWICFSLILGMISWSSRKHNYVTLNTTEAKYIAAPTCFTQVLWMNKTLQDIQVKYDDPI